MSKLARRHLLLAGLLVVGIAVRVVTIAAYDPALIGGADANSYLIAAAEPEHWPTKARPMGYTVLLHLLPLHAGLRIVPLVQHGLALAMGVAIYALLLRLGVRPWLSALAAAPVLLDGWQLLLGQYVMSETLFEALLVAGAVALLWRRPLGIGGAALAGLVFAALALTRANGVVLIVPALLAAVFLGARARALGAMAICFVLPLVAYAVWFESVWGTYGITGYSGRFLYARVAPFVDCRRFEVPPSERILCPKEPLGQRLSVNAYMWSTRRSPQYLLDANRWAATSSFARRAIRHQPLDYARVVLGSALRGFALRRDQQEGAPPAERWRFQPVYPTYKDRTAATLAAYGYSRGHVDVDLARILRGYQSVVYPPGPLMALALGLGALAAAGVGGARRSGLRAAAFLFTALGATLLLSTVAANELSWRYWLPEVVLLPPAGALGWTALVGRRAATRGRVAADAGRLRS